MPLDADAVMLSTFEQLFAEERDRLFSALWLITRDRHEAEEVAQDAFVRVWERWERHGAPDDPAAYLFRTAMNVLGIGDGELPSRSVMPSRNRSRATSSMLWRHVTW